MQKDVKRWLRSAAERICASCLSELRLLRDQERRKSAALLKLTKQKAPTQLVRLLNRTEQTSLLPCAARPQGRKARGQSACGTRVCLRLSQTAPDVEKVELQIRLVSANENAENQSPPRTGWRRSCARECWVLSPGRRRSRAPLRRGVEALSQRMPKYSRSGCLRSTRVNGCCLPPSDATKTNSRDINLPKQKTPLCEIQTRGGRPSAVLDFLATNTASDGESAAIG